LRTLLALAGALACLIPAAGRAQPDRAHVDARLAALRALDGRVATIGHRLATASRDLCATQVWRPGIVVHDLAQYGGADRAAAARLFGLGDGPAVLVVAEGSPAARAGLRPDDQLIALDGVALAGFPPRPRPSFAGVEQALAALERAFADGEAELTISRGGQPMTLRIAAERGCPSRFQLVPGSGRSMEANGDYVSMTSAMVEYAAADDELAAAIAHELAHNVLEHRRQRNEAGVRSGMMGGLGRDARVYRAQEVEADRLSVHLLDRAGFDIDAAARFWRRFGPAGLGLDGPTHPPWRRRVAALALEAQRIREARAAGRPVVAPIATRGPAVGGLAND
jgi:Zn-dependent protease with chaperone function